MDEADDPTVAADEPPVVPLPKAGPAREHARRVQGRASRFMADFTIHAAPEFAL